MSYAIEEDRDPDETQEQQEETLERMEADGQDTTEALVKREWESAWPPKNTSQPPKVHKSRREQ